MVEERQAPGPGLGRHADGVVDRGVTPGGLARELLVGVLGVVDHQVGSVTQLEHAGSTAAVVGHLVVAHEGHAGAVDLDPEPEGRPHVRDPPHPDLGRPDGQVVVVDLDEVDGAVELLHLHREERRDHAVDHLRALGF